MTIATLVEPYLPTLRRYARALTGEQSSGDAYIMAMLESLIADRSILDTRLDPRLAVYKLFSGIWNAPAVGSPVHYPKPGAIAEGHIRAITPLPRQAFLLTAMEGFTAAEAAIVLSVESFELAVLLDTAGREISAQLSTDVLVIEDEPIIAMDLESLLTALGHRILGNARTHADAVALAKGQRPGLVLADIRLADGSSGLEAVNEILESFEVPVIFITAYPESLLTGRRPEPTYLIAKPFRDAMVMAVVSQALFFGTKATARSRRIA